MGDGLGRFFFVSVFGAVFAMLGYSIGWNDHARLHPANCACVEQCVKDCAKDCAKDCCGAKK